MIFEKSGVLATDINWTAPTARTDGDAYGAADHAGYELGISDGAGGYSPWVSVPAAYDVTSWPLNQLNLSTEGDHEVVLRTIDNGGRQSAWSTGVVFTVSLASPNAPTGVDVS